MGAHRITVMRLVLLLQLSLWSSQAFLGPTRPDGAFRCRRHRHHQAFDSEVVPPLEESPLQKESDNLVEQEYQQRVLEALCERMDVRPHGLVRLDTSTDHDAIRGIYLNRAVRPGDVLLSIPLRHCFRDDEPPAWLRMDDDFSSVYHHPSDWASRLAAILLEEQLKQEESDLDDVDSPSSLWFNLLPDSQYLRASLPIHWSSEVVESARCTALEVCVDSAFFPRAQAVQDLMAGLQERRPGVTAAMEPDELRRLCENALDVVQTRSCRVVSNAAKAEWSSPLRLLAPVFDLINHSSPSNAEFGLSGGMMFSDDDNKSARLVVRARSYLKANEQVFIDYGDSARPAWKCLSSYGFLPTLTSESLDDYDDDNNGVAELYIDGARFEVTATTVPEDIVAAVASSMGLLSLEQESTTLLKDHDPEPVELTPEIAVQLARRMSDVAFQMLLDEDHEDAKSQPSSNLKEEESPEEVLSSRLAASLRWNQHRILMACSMGLRDWAVAGGDCA